MLLFLMQVECLVPGKNLVWKERLLL